MRSVLGPLFLSVALSAQGTTFAPAQYAVGDGPGIRSLLALSHQSRQQVMVGASHLQPMAIRALWLRRDAGYSRELQPGVVDIEVRLAMSSQTPLAPSRSLDVNLGSGVRVFQGRVALPYSPDAATRSVGWNAAQDAIRLAFLAPFAYAGGTLCVEFAGSPVTPTFWPLDVALDPSQGAVFEVGQACGPQATPHDPQLPGGWASAAASELIVGGTANLFAVGTPGNLAVMGFANTLLGIPVNLGALGIGEPGCFAYLDPQFTLATTFETPSYPGISYGDAWFLVPIPNFSGLLGGSFVLQWFELAGVRLRTSEAVVCTIAPTVPQNVAMSFVTPNDHGLNPSPQSVHVQPGRGYVMRFDY